MSSQTELLKLALLELTLTPNPWTAGAHFNQTLDLATGTVIVELGTSVIRVWIDAMTDVLRADASCPTTPCSLSVTSTSTRPAAKPWYHGPGATCNQANTNPVSWPIPLQPNSSL